MAPTPSEKRSKPRVFVSHSSKDKALVHQIAWELRNVGLDVWYDEWEIAVGDSIVDKVFEGLGASDTLVVVLSSSSVASRWVKEELSTAVMRRIAENDIRILPVLVEDCEVPLPLNHIRYADFRLDPQDGMLRLLDAIAPEHAMWQSLAHLYDDFGMICDQLGQMDLEADAAAGVIKLHYLMESALNTRTEIELRRAPQRARDLSFFERIGLLADRGVDVRSQTWNALVRFRAEMAHSMWNGRGRLHMFAQMLKDRHGGEDLRKSLVHGTDRLKEIMRMLCFDTLPRMQPGAEPGDA